MLRDGFKLDCPRCKAVADDALLEVISGTFQAMGMSLFSDGFAAMDAKSFDTSDEKVRCHACGACDISLGECAVEDAVEDEDEDEV